MKVSLIFISFIFLVITLSYLVTSQVVQTQVIELTEKVRDFFVEATKGNIVGQIAKNKFGVNLNVGTTEEDIQSQGGTLVFLQSAELIGIISSDTTNDILLGENATSVFIEGLDENFTEISELVNLSAITTNTVQEYIRVNRMFVNQVGNYTSSNAGTITGTAAVSGTVQIEIPVGSGQSKTTHFTVPAGQNLIITAFRVTMDTGKEIDIAAKFRSDADDVVPPVSPIKTIRDLKGLSSPTSGISLGNLKFDEKTDIWVTGVSSIGTAAIEVNYDFVQYAIGT